MTYEEKLDCFKPDVCVYLSKMFSMLKLTLFSLKTLDLTQVIMSSIINVASEPSLNLTNNYFKHDIKGY